MNDKQHCEPCPACGGEGDDDLGVCPRCDGHGYVVVQDEQQGPPARPPMLVWELS